MSATALAALSLGLPLLQPLQPAPTYPEGVWIDFRQGTDAQGLEYMEGFQCSHRLTQIDGVGCAQTIPPNAMYLLFKAPREMIMPDRDTLTFEAEVYDDTWHSCWLEVESTTPSVATGESFFRELPGAQRQNTKKWRWLRWQVTDPAFADPMRDAIRFRLYDEAWWNDGRLLSVSQVRVTHEALVFRSEREAMLCGERLPVTVEACDQAGQALPDGTEVRLSTKGKSLAERPKPVTLTGGKANLELVAGQTPGTVGLYGFQPTAKGLVSRPFFVLAGQGPLEERTDSVTAEQLAATARVEGPTVADSTVDTFTDDQGATVLRGSCVFKAGVPPGEARLVLNAPIAGVPRAFRVALGCPDGSVDSVWARFKDANGELFPYYLELRLEGKPLPPYAERGLECRAIAGPTYVEGPGVADGIMDLPGTLYGLDFSPCPGLDRAELDVWGVETDVLAPAQAGE